MTNSKDKITDPYSSPEWAQLVEDLKGRHAARMNEVLDQLTAKEFKVIYPKLLDFALPRLQKQELIKTGGEDNQVLRIEVVTRPLLEDKNTIDITPKDD